MNVEPPETLVIIESIVYKSNGFAIELWWSQLKSFLRMFALTTTSMIDQIIAVALNLINPQHLRNWALVN
jgi:hypothetical protein